MRTAMLIIMRISYHAFMVLITNITMPSC